MKYCQKQGGYFYWVHTNLILNVDGNIFLLPENGSDENRNRSDGPHQVHHRRLHERQVGQGRGREKKSFGGSSLLR